MPRRTLGSDAGGLGDTGAMETDDSDLETGYGPSTAAGDNLCNDYVRGLAEAYASLAGARGDRVVVDDDLTLTDRGSPSMFANVAVLLRPLGYERWQETARRMHDFYDGAGGGPFLVFSAWPTPDLSAEGFGLVGHPPLMLREPAPISWSVAGDFEIRAVADATGATDWERTMVEGFPEPELQPYEPGCLLPEQALGATGWRHWVGYLDGEPVGMASASVAADHVGVELVCTTEAARGRGVGRAMTATATLAEPTLPALLISSDDGNSVYRRLGYRPLLRFTLWAGHRP